MDCTWNEATELAAQRDDLRSRIARWATTAWDGFNTNGIIFFLACRIFSYLINDFILVYLCLLTYKTTFAAICCVERHVTERFTGHR